MKLVLLLVVAVAALVLCAVEARSLMKLLQNEGMDRGMDGGMDRGMTQKEEEKIEEEKKKKEEEEKKEKALEGWLKILQVPKTYFPGASVRVRALCKSGEGRVGVDVVVGDGDFEPQVTVSRRSSRCGHTHTPTNHTLPLLLPRYLAYKPGFFNRYSVYIDKAILRVWMVSEESYKKRGFDASKQNQHVFVEPLRILKPFERPERPEFKCYSWLGDLLNNIKMSTFNPTCPREEECIRTISFPVALSGLGTGVHRTHAPFMNSLLRRQQRHRITHPEFTFVLWLYLNEACAYSQCSVLQHIMWDDNYATPRISINPRGQLLVELVKEEGTSVVDTSTETMVPQVWTRLILACRPSQCNVTVGYGEGFSKGWTRSINITGSSPFYFDDTVGLLVYGGSELGASFQGYIGKALYHRSEALQPHQIREVGVDEMMGRLRLTEREERCGWFSFHLEQLNNFFHRRQQQRLEKVTCKATTNPILDLCKPLPLSYPLQVNKKQAYLTAYSILKQSAKEGHYMDSWELADLLHERAESLLEQKGPSKMPMVIWLLKQSSCLGNHDATFMLSGILNYGVTVETQEVLSHSYLMDGAVAGNRLCLLALANKHVYGLDGFPVDYEQAYVYFKAVADMTNRDLEVHNRNDVYTEMVRLTRHYEVAEQSEEDGELVTYLRMQASQGEFYATQTLARMYYWGSGGVERDVARAVEYYRMAALHNEPSALYDYGIVLLKGHGVEKNVTMAIEMLRKSAELDYPQAFNTLGWYFMDKNNFSEARDLFHKAHELGNKDASFNLAFMLLNGLYPDSPIDKVRAWEFLGAAAVRGQFDASILVGMYNMRGHPSISRNLQLSIGWIRHVAEQNPGIGRLLFKGLKAYKKQNWFPTLVYYLMAASTGVEVANFNLAYLCEEDYGSHVKLLEKECVWRHYNLSIQRAPKDVDPYAWNKMAHYYYYHGIGGRNDTATAVELYATAALYGDPQGLYNLAMLSNEGVRLNEFILSSLSVPLSIQRDNFLLSVHLLTRCQDSHQQESYLPCTFGLYRVAFAYYTKLLSTYHMSVLGLVVVVVLCVLSLNLMHHRQTRAHNLH